MNIDINLPQNLSLKDGLKGIELTRVGEKLNRSELEEIVRNFKETGIEPVLKSQATESAYGILGYVENVYIEHGYLKADVRVTEPDQVEEMRKLKLEIYNDFYDEIKRKNVGKALRSLILEEGVKPERDQHIINRIQEEKTRSKELIEMSEYKEYVRNNPNWLDSKEARHFTAIDLAELLFAEQELEKEGQMNFSEKGGRKKMKQHKNNSTTHAVIVLADGRKFEVYKEGWAMESIESFMSFGEQGNSFVTLDNGHRIRLDQIVEVIPANSEDMSKEGQVRAFNEQARAKKKSQKQMEELARKHFGERMDD